LFPFLYTYILRFFDAALIPLIFVAAVQSEDHPHLKKQYKNAVIAVAVALAPLTMMTQVPLESYT
jgi:uncharacterized membrane protein YcgQ (UPF0703/DUF1980 family)